MANTVYKEFAEIMKRGDEKVAKEFLISHINDFPEEVRNDLIMSFVEEALASQTETADSLAFQKEGVKMIHELEKIKTQLEDKKKLLDIKENM